MPTDAEINQLRQHSRRAQDRAILFFPRPRLVGGLYDVAFPICAWALDIEGHSRDDHERSTHSAGQPDGLGFEFPGRCRAPNADDYGVPGTQDRSLVGAGTRDTHSQAEPAHQGLSRFLFGQLGTKWTSYPLSIPRRSDDGIVDIRPRPPPGGKLPHNCSTLPAGQFAWRVKQHSGGAWALRNSRSAGHHNGPRREGPPGACFQCKASLRIPSTHF